MNPYDDQAGGPEERGGPDQAHDPDQAHGPDQAHDPEESVAGRVFVPEGPRLDAWIAADGGAVTLSIQAMRMQARWLRRVKPRPFGFEPGSAHPLPEHIGDAHGPGTLSAGVASLLGFRTPVYTMSIRYGDATDPQAPAAEIISDFHRSYQDRDLTEALMTYAASADEQVTSVLTDVAVLGRQRPVSLLRQGEFSAFQVGEGGVLVTVLARHMGAQFPALVRLGQADLEPMIAAMENYDRDLIAAAFAEERRRHVEQLRDQSP